jgi:Ran GTPase-activating protein (RanGAP) involved in mRNA processing and transport
LALNNNHSLTHFCILQKNLTLEVLDVSWNGFGERGMKELQNALKINKRLRVLDLR